MARPNGSGGSIGADNRTPDPPTQVDRQNPPRPVPQYFLHSGDRLETRTFPAGLLSFSTAEICFLDILVDHQVLTAINLGIYDGGIDKSLMKKFKGLEKFA